MFHRRHAARVLLAGLSLLLASIGAEAARAACTLRVGWDEWAPYFTKDATAFRGLEYDLLKSTAAAAGCTLDFVQVPWARALRMVEAGQLDMLYGAGYSAERAAFGKYSIAYREEQFVLMTRRGAGDDATQSIALNDWIRTEDSGRPRTVGVFRGNVYGAAIDRILKENPQRVLVVELNQNEQMVRMLEDSRLDGYLIEDGVAEMQLRDPNLPLRRLFITEQKADPLYYLFSRQVGDDVIARFNAAIGKRKSGSS